MYSPYGGPSRNINVNYPGQGVGDKPDDAVQTDTPRVPVLLHPGTNLDQLEIDSNRLKGETSITLTADNLLIPDAGVLGYVARFLAVAGATGSLLTLISMGAGGIWISLFLASPVVGLTVAICKNGSKWHKVISVYLLGAIAAGTMPFTYWAAKTVLTGMVEPVTSGLVNKGKVYYKLDYGQDALWERNERPTNKPQSP